MNVSGVGHQLSLSAVGVGYGHGLKQLWGPVLTGFGSIGQRHLGVSLKLLLLLLLLAVPLHLRDERVPLAFGHPPKLHRWEETEKQK